MRIDTVPALRAAGTALPFKTDFDDMTCADYANVLLHIVSHTTLPGLKDAVLIELGFGKQVAERLSAGSINTSEEIDLLEICQTSIRIQRTGGRVLLLIGGAPEKASVSKDGYRLVTVPKGEGSVVGSWRISARHAVFPVFISDTGKVEMPRELNPTLIFTDRDFNPSDFPLWALTPPVPRFKVSESPEAGRLLGALELGAPPNLDAAVEMASRKSKPTQV
jgi:hypothetical protein